MTKREIKKEAYKRIVKQGQNHQEVYNDLKTTKPAFNLTIAELISKVPSKGSVESQKNLRTVYLVLMALVIIVRVLGLFLLSETMSINSSFLLLGLVIAVLIPGVGIFALLTQRMETLRSTSFLFIIAIIRSLKDVQFVPEDLIWFIPMAGVIILGLWLPKKLEKKFDRKVVKSVVDGKTITDYEITFEAEKIEANSDILDSDLL